MVWFALAETTVLFLVQVARRILCGSAGGECKFCMCVAMYNNQVDVHLLKLTLFSHVVCYKTHVLSAW